MTGDGREVFSVALSEQFHKVFQEEMMDVPLSFKRDMAEIKSSENAHVQFKQTYTASGHYICCLLSCSCRYCVFSSVSVMSTGCDDIPSTQSECLQKRGSMISYC